MKVRATIQPGQNGTQKMVEKYGDRLICVRYRTGEDGTRYTTVKLIEEKSIKNVEKYKPGDYVGVHIDYQESSFRDLVKQAGGVWKPHQKLWELDYSKAAAIGLLDRIVDAEK